MNKPPCGHFESLIDAAARFVVFLVIATAGMASVGMALLAQPVSQYYADKAFIDQQQQNVQQLKQRLEQQQELLENASNPAVLERFAVANLRYLPAYTARNPIQPLIQSWPSLQYALTVVQQTAATEPDFYGIGQLAKKLTAQPRQQMLLMLSGAGLILVSLTCFGRCD